MCVYTVEFLSELHQGTDASVLSPNSFPKPSIKPAQQPTCSDSAPRKLSRAPQLPAGALFLNSMLTGNCHCQSQCTILLLIKKQYWFKIWFWRYDSPLNLNSVTLIKLDVDYKLVWVFLSFLVLNAFN